MNQKNKTNLINQTNRAVSAATGLPSRFATVNLDAPFPPRADKFKPVSTVTEQINSCRLGFSV